MNKMTYLDMNICPYNPIFKIISEIRKNRIYYLLLFLVILTGLFLRTSAILRPDAIRSEDVLYPIYADKVISHSSYDPVEGDLPAIPIITAYLKVLGYKGEVSIVGSMINSFFGSFTVKAKDSAGFVMLSVRIKTRISPDVVIGSSVMKLIK